MVGNMMFNVFGGCVLSLSTRTRGIHVLSVKPSSLFMLLQCSSVLTAFLMWQSVELVLGDRTPEFFLIKPATHTI